MPWAHEAGNGEGIVSWRGFLEAKMEYKSVRRSGMLEGDLWMGQGRVQISQEKDILQN